MEIIDILLTANFWAAALRIATPLIFGVLGALICERAGVLNLGIEGIFTAGAMAGWMAVWLGAGLWGGVLVAALAGGFFGLIHAILTVPLGLSQHVSGIGVTLLATSLSYFTYRTAMLALVMVFVTGWVLYRTPLGLAIRAVGDNPSAVEAQGLSVYALRIGAVVAGSALMAVGGAFLTMSAFDAFFFGMINGRGWVCIALTVFASWRPGKALLGALLFGAFDAFQVRLQTEVGAFLPSQVFLMMPYLLSIAALIIVARKADYPKALLVPWFKGQR